MNDWIAVMSQKNSSVMEIKRMRDWLSFDITKKELKEIYSKKGLYLLFDQLK